MLDAKPAHPGHPEVAMLLDRGRPQGGDKVHFKGAIQAMPEASVETVNSLGAIRIVGDPAPGACLAKGGCPPMKR